VWVIGALTSLYKKQLFKSVVIPIFFMLGSLIVYRLVDHTTLLKLFTVDLLLGVGLCFLLHYYYTNEKSSLPVWMGWIPNVKLADFSYTLYLVHYPFLFFVSSYLYTKFNGNYGYNLVPNLINILYYVTMIILIYIYSYVMYLLFEKQTKRVRDYLLSKYG
jgi:peptidoglycan/LPS O-acetylase OafA/YrhL